ncbi:hypothetical protein PVL29_009798 [Vitis rotundifolia]|uniref:Retrotransposon Copia-like N-terminal domain-containing protein n=1 Tax=Vitis rotundifolia TaxID=103349 RepID=A0AA39DS01_VITRO|nr:hypothetical protein PVL29_009798 [Vitis rotundifolia]
MLEKAKGKWVDELPGVLSLSMMFEDFSSFILVCSYQNGTSSSPNTTLIMQSLNQAFTIRLDRSNYLLWCTQMLNIVITNGLEEMIDVSQPCLPKFLENSKSTNPYFQIWQRQNLLVMCWIYSSLIENAMPQIIGLTSTFKI